VLEVVSTTRRPAPSSATARRSARSASVHASSRSGGLVLGAPGSGKTTALAVLIEALAWQGIACVVLDPKPSKDLAEVVTGVDGTIWSLGGDRQWDALPADPSELANQLVEVLPVDARTKVYRDAARLWILVGGQALQ
jgi:DNA helicase HerA-like ATPase